MKYKHALGCMVLAVALVGCDRKDETGLAGYVEGEYLRIASPYAGNLATLNVQRGQTVQLNASLFSLESENEKAVRAELSARVAQSQAKLDNLRKGKRADEVVAVRAQLAQAEAAAKLSNAELARTQSLVEQKFLSPARLDEAKSAQERDRARVLEFSAQFKIASLAARPDEIAAAMADLAASQQQLSQAEWRLAQKSQFAPKAALVTDTLYGAGEWVQAGMPVVALLPAENIKIKFFVSETQLGALKIGQVVSISCDGCAAPTIAATISYISPQAEYTSPIIYSKENRATLVYLVEARPLLEDAVKLHPGQPVEVKL